MRSILYETECAVLAFPFDQVTAHVEEQRNPLRSDALNVLVQSLPPSGNGQIRFPTDERIFGYMVLDLLSHGLGSIFCKECRQEYAPRQLKEISIGHGRNPFAVQIKRERRFRGKKLPVPGLIGGRGYQCPAKHPMICMFTWRT